MMRLARLDADLSTAVAEVTNPRLSDTERETSATWLEYLRTNARLWDRIEPDQVPCNTQRFTASRRR